MAYPTKYTRQYDFVSYQNSNPDRPLPADKVNADLNAAAQSSSEIVDFLKKSIRADGAIMNGAVGVDQLSDASKAVLGDVTTVQEILDQLDVVDEAASNAATSASNAASSAASSATSATNASNSATTAMNSATAASNAATALASNLPRFETRATAASATIPVVVTSICIVRYATGRALAPAVYILGTSTGPGAFQEAGGHWWQLDLTGSVVDIRWFNVIGDGITDDLAGVRAAVAAAAGKTLKVTGYYALSDSVALPNNIKILADNWGSSSAPNGLTFVAGAQVHNGMFTVFDDHRGGITVDGLFLNGNSANVNTGSSVGVLFVAPSRLSTTDIDDIEVKNCFFNGFNHNHRIAVQHAAQTDNLVNVRNVRIHHNLVKTVAGNATSGAVNTFVYLNPNNALSAPTATGLIIDVQFKDNTIYGVGVCSAIQGIGGVINAVVTGNHTEGMGNNCDANLTGYTYTFYQSSQTANVPQNIIVANNTGDTHHNFAVYLAGARKCAVTGNVLGGTFRPNAPAGLPWGTAICFNGCSDFSASGNVLRDNYGGICALMSSVPDGRTLGGSIVGNTITCTLNTLGSAAKPPTGIEFEGDISVTVDQQLVIASNSVKMTGDIPEALRYSGGKMGPLKATGNELHSSYIGYHEAAAYSGGLRTFANNTYGGALANGPFITSTSAAGLTIANDEVNFTEVTAGSSSGYIVDGSTTLSLDGLVLRGKTNTGAAFSAIGAVANLLQGFSSPGCTNPVAASSIGLAAPTWTGYGGGYIQNLNTSKGTGTTPNRYMKKGWIWDTGNTWAEDRTGLF